MSAGPADALEADLLELRTGPAANGGSCVARHEGRVVFVRYALPEERVRVRVTSRRGSYWHAEVVEVLEASPDRIESLCPIAGAGAAGCCDLAFADPRAVRVLKAQVVANQLARLGNYEWDGTAEPVGSDHPRGWRTRVRLDTDADGRAGFHRYHSPDLVTDLRCGQLPDGMLDGLAEQRWTPGDHVHVVLDDDGERHVVTTSRTRRGTVAVEGSATAVHRVGGRTWRLPVNAFWQSHRDAPALYSELVGQWTRGSGARRAWDLYGGAGVFAAALADVVGADGSVVSVDTSRPAGAAARSALAECAAVQVVSESVRRFLGSAPTVADIAVLDPPRAGAGREVIEALAAAGVPRVVHFGCEVAAFARDVGEYRRAGYAVREIRVFDAFPLTHHVECAALLVR